MFQIKAGYDEQVDIKVAMDVARKFFSDPRSFTELMPGVEGIAAEPGGVTRWIIRADVPLIGSIRQSFAVRQTEDSAEHIEWSPIPGEKNNLMRYSASFEDLGKRTLVRISQRVEIRREHARSLHLLAGLIGESRLSAEMQKGVNEMMRTFLARARVKLESGL